MQHQENLLLKNNILNVIKRLQSALFSKFDNNKRIFNCEIIMQQFGNNIFLQVA